MAKNRMKRCVIELLLALDALLLVLTFVATPVASSNMFLLRTIQCVTGVAFVALLGVQTVYVVKKVLSILNRYTSKLIKNN